MCNRPSVVANVSVIDVARSPMRYRAVSLVAPCWKSMVDLHSPCCSWTGDYNLQFWIINCQTVCIWALFGNNILGTPIAVEKKCNRCICNHCYCERFPTQLWGIPCNQSSNWASFPMEPTNCVYHSFCYNICYSDCYYKRLARCRG